jgi:hypothetical protein
MATWDDVRALGYTVAEAQPDVMFVSGNGLQTYVKADDQAQIDSLADPVLHAERITPPVPLVPVVPVPSVGDVAQQPDGSYGIVVSVTNGNVEVAPLAPAVATEASALTLPTA